MKNHTEQPCKQPRTPHNNNLHPAALLSIDNAVYAAIFISVNGANEE
jgi:hypothetical protein